VRRVESGRGSVLTGGVADSNYKWMVLLVTTIGAFMSPFDGSCNHSNPFHRLLDQSGVGDGCLDSVSLPSSFDGAFD